MKQAGARIGAGLYKRLVMRGTVATPKSRFSDQNKCLNDPVNAKEDMLS